MEKTEFEKEKNHLRKIIKLAKKSLDEEELTYNKLEKLTEDEYLLDTLAKNHSTKYRNLLRAIDNPYFARIDFIEEGVSDKLEVYIGKTNIFDDENNVAVADWRAPISTMYYDSEIGKTSYKCQEGIIEGELTLKRQYKIENAELLEYNDINITTTDELLQECLNEKSDIRLKNIVSTIQKEQNAIIRASMQKPLIVQGVAGSGKTTVAIHRIAYLIYTYEKNFKPEDFLIIAPNKFFLDYIKDSLPDLGVDYVRQETFEELATHQINTKLKIENSNENLIKIVENNENSELIKKSCKFKGSLEFKDIIDEYLYDLNLNILSKNDFVISGIKIISWEKLQEILMDNYERFDLKTRLEKLKGYIQNKIENQSQVIQDAIIRKRNEELEKMPENLRIKIFEKYEKDLKLLYKNSFEKIANNYIKTIKIPVAERFYADIINDLYEEKFEFLKKEFNKKMKNKRIEYEDLTGIMHIHYKLYGLEKKYELKHIVIDEAQDFNEFQFYTLNEILSNNKSLTILGDIVQGIFDYRGTNNWNEINEKIFENEANIEYLKKSYRTTEEVMNEANKIIAPIKDELNIALAEPVSRHGEKVEYINSKSYDEKLEKMEKIIKNEIQNGYKNIAIIGKNMKICKKLYDDIKSEFQNIEIISDSSSNYNGGVTVVPSYHSKGLEFDAVIIADFDSYTENLLDKKLLYVALTRAMHKLKIFI